MAATVHFLCLTVTQPPALALFVQPRCSNHGSLIKLLITHTLMQPPSGAHTRQKVVVQAAFWKQTNEMLATVTASCIMLDCLTVSNVSKSLTAKYKSSNQWLVSINVSYLIQHTTPKLAS